jgi:hypothetical protein
MLAPLLLMLSQDPLLFPGLTASRRYFMPTFAVSRGLALCVYVCVCVFVYVCKLFLGSSEWGFILQLVDLMCLGGSVCRSPSTTC